MRRWWAVLLIVPGVAWSGVRLSGWDSWYPIAQLVAFTPYAAMAALLPVPWLAWRRRWWPAAIALGTAVTLALCVLPRSLANSDRLVGAAGPRLRVLTANVLAGSADAHALARLVRQHRVDVLALQEVTPSFAADLAASGISGLLPSRTEAAQEHASGSALLARYPLRELEARITPGGFRQTRAMLTMPDGTTVEVESVHVFSPYTAEVTALWRRSLRSQPPATPEGELRVLLGDFNATLDHRQLRELIATGYRDAADVGGAGWTGTWGPYDGDPIPPVVLDHVLADARIGVTEYHVLTLPGSDHRPVLTELILP